MKRTASMNLDWEKDDDGYIAQLPPVPGYPGTWYASVDRFTGISDDGDWYLTIFNELEPSIFLPNIPGIVSHADTPEELMNNVEENLTPEMIADALQAIGIEPGDLATASRKATHRTASLDFDWRYLGSDVYDSDVNFNIPGYTYSPEYSWAEVYLSNYGWVFQFYIDGLKKDGSTTAVCNLYNRDFGIPDADSADEMMSAVENLNPQDIADALQAKGYEPTDDTTAARHASKRTAHFDLDWKKYYNSNGAYYEAKLPSIPGYTTPGYVTQTIVWGSVDNPNLWTFLIWMGGINDGRGNTHGIVQLNADDFGIPDAETAEEMMQAVENLSMDDIIFVLQQEGCQPYEED